MASGFSRSAYLGDTITINVTVSRNGGPVDLTGASLWFTGKESVDDADIDAVFQKTEIDGITITDAVNGRARIVIAPADTSGLANEDITLECDLQVQEADGTVTTAARGSLTLIPQVTRA